MIKFLLFILLLLGLVESIISISTEEGKNKKMRAILYIVLFIVGIAVMLIQEKEADDLVSNIESTLKKVVRIDSVANQTLISFEQNLQETNDVYTELNSTKQELQNIVKQENELIENYRRLNSQLAKQIEYEETQLLASIPIVQLPTNYIKWESLKDNKIGIKICFQNNGIRPVELKKYDAKVAITLHEQSKSIDKPFPNLFKPAILTSYEKTGMMTCKTSYPINIDVTEINDKIKSALVQVQYESFDASTKDLKKEIKHFTWTRNEGFRDVIIIKVNND